MNCAPKVRHWIEVRGRMAKFSLKFKQEVAEKLLGRVRYQLLSP